jgi:hypothetical protein
MTRTAGLALALGTVAVVTTGATVGVGSRIVGVQTRVLTHTTCTLGGGQTTDTYLEGQPPKNQSFTHGSDATLLTDANTGRFKEALVEFDLTSSVCPHLIGAEVDSATLTLSVSGVTAAPRTIDFDRVTSSWSDSTSYDSAPSASGTPSASATVSGAGSLSVDLTADVDDFAQSESAPPLAPYGSSIANDGWELVDANSASKDATVTMSSSEGSSPPQLQIAYAY